MKKIVSKLYIVLFSIALIVTFTSSNLVSQGNDVVIVVNKGASNLSKSQIKKIFKGKSKRWPNGTKLKVLLNKNKSVYSKFCKKYLNKSTRDIDNAWSKQKIRNGTPKPRKVPSSVVLMMVKNSKSFIGFVERSKAKGVKIIE